MNLPAKEIIRIECTSASTLPLEKIIEFQGELKSLSEMNYARLKNSILELGFISPFHIWEKHPGEYCCLDGTQRLRTLLSMKTEGYVIPDVPVTFIQAGSVKEAKKKLLSLASQYGKVEGQGLYQFMMDSGLEFTEIKDSFTFPEINFDAFELEFIKDNISNSDVSDGSPNDLQSKKLSERFLVPPFSVLDTRQGYWQDRKREWLSLGIQSELGRGGMANDKFSDQSGMNDAKRYNADGSRGSRLGASTPANGNKILSRKGQYAYRE